MKKEKIEDRMLYYRGLTDYKLLSNEYVIIMLDGRSFSHFCKQFKKPFDEHFISVMNEVTKYLCEEVEGCRFGYTQSDEISLLLTDFGNSESWFGYRLSKLLSITASLASAKFNQLMIARLSDACSSIEEFKEKIVNLKLASFDSKAWNVPTQNDVFTWFLFRQTDCVKNSKQMLSQSFFKQKDLDGLTTDKQVELLIKEKNIDWNTFSDGVKYGRFVYKQEVEITNGKNTFKRNKWFVHNAFPLFGEGNKEKFFSLNVLPKKE